MDWSRIPSLFSLRAFEAVSRHESFTRAAAELNVTHAAISQHVRTLEAEFSQTLLRRKGRGVELTDAGRQLAGSLSDGFGTIAGGVERLRQYQAERPLMVTTTPSFAENWLMPRLGSFWVAHPDVRLSLNPGVGLTDLHRDGIDLAIRYGRGDWPDYSVEHLTSARFFAVTSPELAERDGLKPGSDLTGEQWFFEDYFSEHRRWAKTEGFINDDTKIETFDTLALVMSAVRSGYGLTVAGETLVERDLAAGSLIPLAEGKSEEFSYYLLTPRSGPTENARKFIRWLKTQA